VTGIGGLQVVLEVTIFGEDVVQRLVDDVVGSGMDERRVLIDQVAFVSSKRTNAVIWRLWMTSSSGIVFLLGVCIQAIFCRVIMRCAVRAISCARARFNVLGTSKRRRTSSMVTMSQNGMLSSSQRRAEAMSTVR
jgi:hypothetical protein